MNKNCEICGKEFFLIKKNKKYCSVECREKNKEIQHNKYFISCNHLSTVYSRRILKNIIPMPCLECNCEVIEIYKRSRNANTNNETIRVNFE